MKIEWNKVTWYSKLVAVILGLIIFALGFYLGFQYRVISQPIVFQNSVIKEKSVAKNDAISSLGWQTYNDDIAGFSFDHPVDYIVNTKYFSASSTPGIWISIDNDITDLNYEADGACGSIDADTFAAEENAVKTGIISTTTEYTIGGIHKIISTNNGVKGFYSIQTCQGLADMNDNAATSVLVDFFKGNQAVTLTFYFPLSGNIKVKDINQIASELLAGTYNGSEQSYINIFNKVLATFTFTK